MNPQCAEWKTNRAPRVIKKSEDNMQELEYKFLISNERFQELLRKANKNFGEPAEKVQTNYYYDTVDCELARRKITVRIREKDGQLKLQTKQHTYKEKAFLQSEETEMSILELPDTLNLKSFPELTLIKKGSLQTTRYSFYPTEGIDFDFDENKYLDVYDYEIEIEFLEQHRERAEQLISDFNLIEGKDAESKSQRFFNRQDTLNKN